MWWNVGDHDVGCVVAEYPLERGAATRAVALFSAWSFRNVGLSEPWLRAHRDNVASQQVASRAGFRRDPQRDKTQEVKGEVWPMLGYALSRPAS
ncbi:GNAT family N-acetyltransferase [Streptosporangium sandarakinum]|uniref:GNAT family N-acetyltransferase n=1 Tax=Streptosporangium sandarakinum TaxID=1260955 RepID=UPI0033B97FBE